jgi:hypothetical protein
VTRRCREGARMGRGGQRAGKSLDGPARRLLEPRSTPQQGPTRDRPGCGWEKRPRCNPKHRLTRQGWAGWTARENKPLRRLPDQIGRLAQSGAEGAYQRRRVAHIGVARRSHLHWLLLRASLLRSAAVTTPARHRDRHPCEWACSGHEVRWG